MIKQKLIVANWKENPESLEVAEKLLKISNLKITPNPSLSRGEQVCEFKILHAVPSIYAGVLAKETNTIILQNISEFEGGSHTGEISVKQMFDCGIKTSIIGHSETRLSPTNPKGDENVQVNLKAKSLIGDGTGFLLCVGEYERAIGNHFDFVKQQLEECLKDIPPSEIADNVIAYEPVWAIGKNAKRVATEAEIIEMMKFIKNFVKEKWGVETHVLYGGSVDENNAKQILELEEVDGLLIGRASSNPGTWEKLLINISENVPMTNSNTKKALKYNTISDLNIQKDAVVLLRLDLNVPINEKGEIVNDFRIQESLPTIKMLQELGAKIIIIAHREKGDFKIVAEYLKNKIANFKFIKHPPSEAVASVDPLDKGDTSAQVQQMHSGDVLLLDNLRLNEGEKKNDENFAKSLANLAGPDGFYINEAFSASHREHASILGIPKILGAGRCALGPKFIEEITKLGLALEPKHPMLLIVGGAKFDTKLAMLEKFLNLADNIFVGGALAHNFWKQKFNYNLGKSLLDQEVKLSSEVLNASKIILPADIMVESREVKKPNEVMDNERIVDFGEKSLSTILNLAEKANTIVWNGPLGYYEGGYESGTKNLLVGLANLQMQFPEKVIILGGGDTVTEIDRTNEQLENDGKEKMRFTHVSTGGGAMIDFLSNGTLPGIESVTNSL